MSANSKPDHYRRSRCRACDNDSLEPFLGLGEQPLANSFLKIPEEFTKERRYPLDVYRCTDCSLVQLLDVINPEILFRDYIYVTGTSQTMAQHNRSYADTIVSDLKLDNNSLVVEIASNDGSLLGCFREHGVRTLGIEPARNIAAMARERDIDTVSEFFDSELASKLRSDYGAARVVVANNVLAHVDNPGDFLVGCRALIDDSGRIVTEFPYLGNLLDSLEYDTIYHEHLCYFSILALMRLYEKAGLVIVRVDKVPVHGGSVRVHGTRKSDQTPDHAIQVQELAAEERQKGYHTPEPYGRFASEVKANRQVLLDLLAGLKSNNKKVVGYGAPAKGNTLLNYCGIDTRLVDFIVDRNPLKVGLYTPGTHIPVKPVSALDRDFPDYVVILAWNFAEEIMRDLKAYAASGGRFILPIPQAKVVTP